MNPASPSHFVSASCKGKTCRICGKLATHKVGEEIATDDPDRNRHNLTAHLCCPCYRALMGPAAPCFKILEDGQTEPLTPSPATP